MTGPTPETVTQQLSAYTVRAFEFPAAKYGRGYERRAVDSFVDRMASTVEDLQNSLRGAQAEINRLEKRVIEGPEGDSVIQAVNVITNAQRTADSTIAEANAYAAKVMSEARAAYDDARRRGAALEQDAEENVRQLNLTAKVHQAELDRQTAYLQTLHDATRTQMEKFLEGMLSHLAEEYGRAHPIAAAAAANGQSRASEPAIEQDAHRPAGQAHAGIVEPDDRFEPVDEECELLEETHRTNGYAAAGAY